MEHISHNYEGFNVKIDSESTVIECLQKLELSKRYIRYLFNNKCVYINGLVANKSKMAVKGDIIEIKFLDEIRESNPCESSLDIVYEDSQILVINKSPNEVVHPTSSHQENTLLQKIEYYFQSKGINRKVRLINRLDKDTSGLLLIAKNPFIDQQISKQIESGQVEKKYIAICNGTIENDYGVIEEPILFLQDGTTKKYVDSSGQYAKTEYWVIKRMENMTLIEIKLHTGRSHQIRVHFSHIGHFIIGDTLYGLK
ncbi:MAG: RluA family pseudouridine synthase, partial [Tissierellia bacterium]|nr:RluA family pseudouridine synthase [Tissierellia bacterium]